MSHASYRLLLLAAAALALWAAPGFAQQIADPDFHPAVAHPAYIERHPSVLFDEAHFNFHTMSGRYQPFTELIRNDGYQVTPNKSKVSPEALKGCAILVIANAQGADEMGQPEAADPAFADQECDSVRDWVHAGGALLLIADHYPFGAAMGNLARRFGIEMRAGYTE